MAIVWSEAQWSPTTPYTAGARVLNAGGVYLCRVGGTSGMAPGPVFQTTGVLDGSVTWDWLGAYAGINVLGVAPYLATGTSPITPGAAIIFLGLAETLVADPAIWIGGVMDYARCYLAAHFGELSKLRAHGPVTAEAVGALSRSYASLLGPYAVDLTASGRAYMDLVRGTPATLGLIA